MKKHSQRAQRVGDQIQRELAELLRNEVKDPRVGPVTVTAVDVSARPVAREGASSRISPAASTPTRPCAALQRTAGFLRTAARRTGCELYSVPQLHFAYDDSIESGMRLSQLIDDAVAADHKLAV